MARHLTTVFPTPRRARLWLGLTGLTLVLITVSGCGDVLGPKYPDPVIEEPGKDVEEDDG